jgi:anti-sigma B factor antagonist
MSDLLVPPQSIPGRVDVLPAAFRCSWTGGGQDAAWVHLSGELDVATAPQLRRTLRESQLSARLVVLDLRGLAFMDSSGVHAIIDASVRARQAGCRMVVLRGPPNVDRALMLSRGIDDVEIHDLDPREPLLRVLRQLADAEPAS